MTQSNRNTIRNSGHGNVFNVTQTTAATAALTRLTASEPVERLESSDVAHAPRRITFAALALGAIAVVADVTGLLATARLPKFYVYLAAVMVALLFAMANEKQLRLLRIRRLLRQSNQYFRDGKAARLEPDGSISLYEMTAPCTYQDCTDGVVHLADAPPREQHMSPYIGICSRGKRLHTYRVDANGVATPALLDWRPPDPPPPER